MVGVVLVVVMFIEGNSGSVRERQSGSWSLWCRGGRCVVVSCGWNFRWSGTGGGLGGGIGHKKTPHT